MIRIRASLQALCYSSLLVLLILAACGSSGRSSLPEEPEPTLDKYYTSRIVTPTVLPSDMARPIRLEIPAIQLHATIEPVGIQPDGDLATPVMNQWENAGWYSAGPRPGEQGSAIIDGHLDRPGGLPAVFWHLRDMHAGDEILVTTVAGKTLHFHVTRIAFYAAKDAPLQEIFGNSGGAYLNLITCAGDWIPSERQTTLRQVVYSVLDQSRP